MARPSSDLRPLEFVLGVSGASGTCLALRFLELLVPRSEVGAVHVVVSEHAIEVARTELREKLRRPEDLIAIATLSTSDRKKVRIHANTSITAPISSGSYPTGGMAIVPCSASTLAAIATGVSRGLLQRAADVTLKERRRLVLAFRESPFSLVHVEAMRSATLAGAIIAPPVPPYYLSSTDPELWLDHTVVRYLDLLGLAPERNDVRWGKGKGKRVEG